MPVVRSAAIALIAVVATALLLSPVSAQQYPAAPRFSGVQAQRTAHIYLLKGLADVFSSGMDSLAAKLAHRGIAARVASHASADSLAAEVAQLYRSGSRAPVIIAGHSLGADAAVIMAQRLAEDRVPVALMITFGPLASLRVPPNVGHAINYYQANSAWRGVLLGGRAANVNLDHAADVNHLNIEKVDRIQNQAVAAIVAAIGRRR
jgi:hypothetical protein